MQTQNTNTMKELIQEKWNKRPLIISGPCSAETEEQVIETATRLAKTGKVDVLRAGIWKPRTKPGLFEGIGAKGLPWLAQAKKIRKMIVQVYKNLHKSRAADKNIYSVRNKKSGLVINHVENIELKNVIFTGKNKIYIKYF